MSEKTYLRMDATVLWAQEEPCSPPLYLVNFKDSNMQYGYLHKPPEGWKFHQVHTYEMTPDEMIECANELKAFINHLNTL